MGRYKWLRRHFIIVTAYNIRRINAFVRMYGRTDGRRQKRVFNPMQLTQNTQSNGRNATTNATNAADSTTVSILVLARCVICVCCVLSCVRCVRCVGRKPRQSLHAVVRRKINLWHDLCVCACDPEWLDSWDWRTDASVNERSHPPPHPDCVAALPCEMYNERSQTARQPCDDSTQIRRSFNGHSARPTHGCHRMLAAWSTGEFHTIYI